jgi:hypothetical protein
MKMQLFIDHNVRVYVGNYVIWEGLLYLKNIFIVKSTWIYIIDRHLISTIIMFSIVLVHVCVFQNSMIVLNAGNSMIINP